MFNVQPARTEKPYRIAIIALLALSIVALAVTVWVEVDFLREQEIVQELIQRLPSDATASAEELAGELRWQFRLTTLVVLNLVVTGCAVVLLWRAFRSSQESLRDFKALAGDILGSVDQVVVTTDIDNNITSINRRGMTMFSIGLECVGHPLASLSKEIALDSFHNEWRQRKSSPMTRDFTTNRDGTLRTLRASCQTLTDNDGNEIGDVLQLRDVTEQVLIEERMRRMERYMGLGSLAAGLHHEIKNPLAALSLHVQLLEEQVAEGSTDDDVQQMLTVIKTEVDRIGDVLEGFRDFASVEALNLQNVDLHGLICRLVELISPHAKRHGIDLCVHAPAQPLPRLIADRVRLEQVLLNLLMNAMEAMPEGGTVTVDATAGQQTVNIQVRDTGNGIPDDLRDRIFDPYFTTKSNGTGLGLGLCDKIVRQHNGSLDFQTSKSGTTFNMTLPIDATKDDSA